MKNEITKELILASPFVHNFAKQIIRMSENLDPIDVLNDLELVHTVIENEVKRMTNND